MQGIRGAKHQIEPADICIGKPCIGLLHINRRTCRRTPSLKIGKSRFGVDGAEQTHSDQPRQCRSHFGRGEFTDKQFALGSDQISTNGGAALRCSSTSVGIRKLASKYMLILIGLVEQIQDLYGSQADARTRAPSLR